MDMKNIFDLHKDILGDYKLYIDSFINIADEKYLLLLERILIPAIYIQSH